MTWQETLPIGSADASEQQRAWAEIERLRDCEEIKLVAFLQREDVLVGQAPDSTLVVHDKYWRFEGRADNIVSAARTAMLMERKYLAGQGAGAGE